MFLLMWEGFWARFFLGSSDAGILPWCLSCSEGSDWDEVVEVHRGGRCPSSSSWACSVSHMPSRDGSGKKGEERSSLLGTEEGGGRWILMPDIPRFNLQPSTLLDTNPRWYLSECPSVKTMMLLLQSYMNLYEDWIVCGPRPNPD